MLWLLCSLALSLSVAETKTEEGELICRNQFVIFIIGVGGFGGKRSSENLKVRHTYIQQL